MVVDFSGASPLPQDRVGFSPSRVGQHSPVLARRVQAGRPHAYPPNCDFGSVRRRARYSAALGRQGARLSPLLAGSTVLAVMHGGRRNRYRHDTRHCAAPSAHGGAALLLRVLRAAARLPTAGLLRAGELFWATLSPPSRGGGITGGRSGGEIVSGKKGVPRNRAVRPGAATSRRTGAKLQGSVHR